MYRLVTLGSLALTNDAGAPVITQRRRLALLALLAAAGEKGVSRDKLVAYLWPESPNENARHSLEQLFYALRRELGDGFGATPAIPHLDPALIASDVSEFESAIDARQFETAVGLYRGPFLDGFYLGDTPEFERWAAGERSRLEGRYAAALEALANDARVAGDHPSSIAWARKLAVVNPLSARGALALMRALVSAGDSAGALQHARVYESLIRAELGAVLEPEIASYVARLRAGESPDTPTATAPSNAARAALRSAADPAETPTRRIFGKRAAVALAGAVLVAVLAIWAGATLSSGAEGTGVDKSRIVVLPFRVSSADSSLAYLREGIVDILGTKLTGEGGPVAVDPRTTLSAWRRAEKVDGGEIGAQAALKIARGLGAGRVLLGEIVRTGPATIVMNGTVLAVPSGDVSVRSSVNGAADSLVVLVNRFVAELLALHAGEVEQRLSALAETPLPALRAFLEGRKADRSGNYESAVARYTRAIGYDSTFALAGLELAASAGLSFRLRPIEQATADEGWYAEFDTTWRRGVGVATRQQGRLGSRDRIYLIALRGSRYPASTPAREQLGNWQRAVDAAPDRAEGWYRLGHTLLYQGPAMGLPDSWARAAGAFRRALQLDSSFMAPVAGLIEIAAFARDTAEVRRLSALYFSRDSVGETADYLRWRAASFDENAAAALRAVRARFPAFGAQTLSRIQWTSQVGAIETDDGTRAISELDRRAADPLERTRAWVNKVQMKMNRGRPDEARALVHPDPALQVSPHLRLRFGIGYALFWDYTRSTGEESAAQLAIFERALTARSEVPPLDALSPLLSGTLWRLSHGDTVGAAHAISWLRRAAADAPVQTREAQRRWPDVVEPLLAAELRRPDAGVLLDRLDSLTQLGCCAVPHWANFVVAKLRERAGEPKAALAAIRRARWYFPPEYLSGVLREEGRLAALTGDVPGAISAYRDYLALRADPEPAWRADLEQVRAALRELERSQSRK